MELAIINNFRTLEEAKEYINKQNNNLDYIILFEPDYSKEEPWTVNMD